MDHITDYFQKYKKITQSTLDQKNNIQAVLAEFRIEVSEDAIMLKGGFLRIFCNQGTAMLIRTIEADIIKACRAKNINVSRITAVMVQ